MSPLTANEVLVRYMNEYHTRLMGVNERETPNGDASLHTACIRGRADEVEALLKGGAEVNLQGEEGHTPLHYSVSGGHVEIVRLLLRHGARTDIRNNFGKTPRDRAVDNKMTHIATLLDESGRA